MTLDQRARTHIKAVAKDMVELTKEAQGNDTVATFYSGIITGLAAAVQIADGATSERAMEAIITRLQAAVGQAYLDGKIPAPAPSTNGPTVREAAAADRAWDIEKAGE
ncbi:MAG: hypothetical protein LBV60_25875 [Streptomyces sp.]|jgi:hypothetical protein|nr:hypothetical protein [Streptomyces sp.]